MSYEECMTIVDKLRENWTGSREEAAQAIEQLLEKCHQLEEELKEIKYKYRNVDQDTIWKCNRTALPLR